MRDPTTTIHAEDLQAGSSYNIPKLTQQTFGKLRAADEIIDEVRKATHGCKWPDPVHHSETDPKRPIVTHDRATSSARRWARP